MNREQDLRGCGKNRQMPVEVGSKSSDCGGNEAGRLGSIQRVLRTLILGKHDMFCEIRTVLL